jgi:hypothetical protein
MSFLVGSSGVFVPRTGLREVTVYCVRRDEVAKDFFGHHINELGIEYAPAFEGEELWNKY